VTGTGCRVANPASYAVLDPFVGPRMLNMTACTDTDARPRAVARIHHQINGIDQKCG
jgi:hypothetical protein